jgi:hypothetical protein
MLANNQPRLALRVEGDTPFLDREDCREAGKALHDEYVHNQPFPHIALENFLPIDALRRVLADFPKRQSGEFDDAYSKLKTGYRLDQVKSPYINNLFSALNSEPFMVFLEEMTGIKGLVPDPYFAGGGLHETARGGHLSVHADFNIHPRTHLHRRLNLILFLNEGWKSEWGGQLELWDKQMKGCVKAVEPTMGNAVIFNTDSDSYHGHPDPLEAPADVYRRSIALYYYTAPEGAAANMERHSTMWQVRPGSHDVPMRGRSLMDKVKGLIR